MQSDDDICPRLRADVTVTPFASITRGHHFVVSVDKRHFIVDRPTSILIEALRDAHVYASLAERLSATLEDGLDVDSLRDVVNARLPAALFAVPANPEVARSPLIWQVHLVGERGLEPLLRWTSRLFRRNVAAFLIAIFLFVDAAVIWRVWGDGIVHLGTLQVLVAMMLTLIGTLWHEIGHVSACHRFGVPNGGIGFGFYWFVPTFYAEVGSAWRLPQFQRAAVDAGGLYFQSAYLIFVGLWALVAADPSTAMAVLWLSHFMMLYTLNPVLKFDGYWLLTDLSGSVNLHERISKTARSISMAFRLSRSEPDVTVSRADILLLMGFVVAACAFFLYLLHSLGVGLGKAIGAVMASVSNSSGWVVMAHVGLVLLLACLATLVALRIARVIGRVFTASDALDE